MIYTFMRIPERFSVNIALIGEQKTGKTTFTEHFIKTMVQYQDKPVLILDCGNQYEEYKAITIAEIKNWAKNVDSIRLKNPVVRILLKKHKSRTKTLEEFADFCNNVHSYVANSCIIFEDLLSLVGKVVPLPFQAVLFNNRNVGNDILMNIHSLGDCPKTIFQRTQVFYNKFTLDVDIPTKAIYTEQFKAIKQLLEIENSKIVTLPQNTKKIQYATVEFIADIPMRLELEALGIPFNDF